MTSVRKQYMYKELPMSNLHGAVWASVAVSIYQDCNIDNRLNTRGGILDI